MGINLVALRTGVVDLPDQARIYVLSVIQVPDDYDAILRRSGIFHGTMSGVRGSFGTSGSRIATGGYQPLVLVLWDGNEQVTRHAPHTLGFKSEAATTTICVVSLEGIRCKDGRDLKQRNAFMPEGITATNEPE